MDSFVESKKNSWSKLPLEAICHLQTLAIKLWPPEDVDDVSVRQLKGALTNEVYECSWNTSTDGEGDAAADGNDAESGLDKPANVQAKKHQRVVLVRVYGKGVENFFNREDEIRTFEAMSRAGKGPRLLGRFSTGRIEEFLHARTLTAKDLRDPDVSARIAEKLREFHHLSMPGKREPQIWKRLRDWLMEAVNISSAEHKAEFRLQHLDAEIKDLELRASKFDSEIGFCHNDLQYGNIMMDDETSNSTIIDYEYATYNPIAYDLANHFCEMAANYHTDTPHLLDFSKYPELNERQRFIRAYLGSPDNIVNSSEVEQLSDEVDFYRLASHIHWGLWGLISHYVNGIEFDYLEYARQRFNQFFLKDDTSDMSSVKLV